MLNKFLKIFRSFSKNERLIFSASALAFVIAGVFLSVNFIDKNTAVTAVEGGDWSEAVLGQPSFVNPILMNGNEPDRNIAQILFSNIFDLADSVKTSKDNKEWTIRLKENIVWDDGAPITSDDIVFTAQAIKNPDSRSSLFPVWSGVQAERVSEREVKIVLASPYAFFDSVLKELRPIPKHIFGSLPAANLRLSNYNLEPVANGPFKFASFSKRNDGFITEYHLVKNSNYFGEKPYLDSFSFKFYEDEKKLIQALNSGAVDGAGGLSQDALKEIGARNRIANILIPRYYAVFFNSYAHFALGDKNVRLALNYAVPKNEIVQKVMNDNALIVSGPLLPGMYGYSAEIDQPNEFSEEKAKQILDLSGWQIGSDGIREKYLGPTAGKPKTTASQSGKTKLEFTLIVPRTKFLIDSANIIAQSWSEIGVKLNLVQMDSDSLNSQILQTRNYEMILFGNIFGNNPDLFSFWHSSERFYPGLNLALYDSRIADSFLELTRAELNPEKRQTDMTSIQSLIIEDAPAVFLFSPYYTYAANARLNGFEEKFIPLPDYRFQNIEKWYVKTARVFR